MAGGEADAQLLAGATRVLARPKVCTPVAHSSPSDGTARTAGTGHQAPILSSRHLEDRCAFAQEPEDGAYELTLEGPDGVKA